MKILLDENLPLKVNYDFGGNFEVLSTKDMNWLGVKNGTLLGLAVEHGFGVFITIDKNIVHQQNLKKFNILFILLNALNNRPETIQDFIPKIKRVLESSINNNYIEIN